MAGRSTSARDGRFWLGCAVLAAALSAQAAAAQDAPGAVSRIRGADARATELLRAGCHRSPIFQRLVDRIEQSDLIVYVETRRQTLPGQLNFVVANGGNRYLRIALRGFGLENDVLPWLAHELQHAVEIAGAPEVKTRADLHTFYERIGGGSRTSGSVELETIAAQETQERVLGELRRGTLASAQ